MEKKTSEIMKNVCAGLFILLSALCVFSRLRGIFGSSQVFAFLGGIRLVFMIPFILVAAGILTRKRTLSMVGCIVVAVLSVLFWRGPFFNSLALPAWMLTLAAWVVASVSCMSSSKKAVILGYICAGLLIVANVLGYINELSWLHGSVPTLKTFIYWVFSLCDIASYAALALLGFAFPGVPVNTTAKTNPAPNTTDDKIERLTKLKDLLDKGILTPEEFQEKKKQILDT